MRAFASFKYSSHFFLARSRFRFPSTFRRKFALPNVFHWKFSTFAAFLGLTIYLAVSATLFSSWVEPSLRGANGWRIGADSTEYMEVSLRGVPIQELVTPSLNLFAPVMLALWLETARNIAIFNIALFLLALLIVRCGRYDLFLFWILLNPLTFPSLLTLNKEILCLFCAVLFWRWLETRRMTWFCAALVLSVMVRWEQACVLLLFLVMLQFKNRQRALIVLLLILSPMSRFLHSSMDTLLVLNQSAITDFLVRMQDYGLYFVLFPLKFLVMLTSQVIQWWNLFDSQRLHDLPTGLFVLGHQLCMCAVLFLVWRKGLIRLSSDAVYFMAVYAVIYCAAPLNQPRYFFFCYVLATILFAKSQVASAPTPNIHDHFRLPSPA